MQARSSAVFGSVAVLSIALVVGCRGTDASATPTGSAAPARSASAGAAPASTAQPSTAASGSDAPPKVAADTDRHRWDRYPWLADAATDAPRPTTTLLAAMPTPPGAQRIEVAPGSFAEWLRELPLAASGTPVKSWSGREIYASDDEYVAAVVALDVGKADLQQSPEVVVRLHAEWQFSRGERDVSYLAATKDPMPYSKWVQGLRLMPQGPHLYWVKKTKPSDPNDHVEFREYLDSVFMWANSTSVRMQSDPVEPNDLRPGDFFMASDKSAHTVVVLDVARRTTGERIALLAQALGQASNVHVLRLGRGTAWFSLRPPQPLLTPHSPEFAWNQLRRLKEPPTQAAKR